MPKRTSVLYFFLLVVCVVFLVELVKKSLIAHRYYRALSEGNKTKERLSVAPRGVFFDRDGVVLVSNTKNKKYGYIRTFLFPYATAHVLGYLGLPSEVNLKDYSCGKPPLSYQYMGKSGLERHFECRLRGIPGRAVYEVDAQGREVVELARNVPQEGENITLSISAKLQQIALKEFGSQKGAAIATDPRTGEVLLFYSSPSFDPSILISGTNDDYDSLINDSNEPLFNRLTSGAYPPGSVVKPLIALAALEEHAVTRDTIYEDTGIFKLGGVEFGNWYYLQYGKKEGEVDLEKAIARSNDIYFYRAGLKLGIDGFNKWFDIFSLGKTNVSRYFGQRTGTIPSPTWKKKTLGEGWYLGDTVNLSIGQGYIVVNPVQMHYALSAVAGKGKQCAFIFEKNSKQHCAKLPVSASSIELVTRGMIRACDTGGTGWPFFEFKVRGVRMKVACKTGTAESQSVKHEPHAWFTVFAPSDNPTIALTILVENGGEGSSVAAPIAKKILEAFFK